VQTVELVTRPMHSAGLLTRLGLVVAPDFLDREFCSNIVSKAGSSAWMPATISLDIEKCQGGELVDERLRSTLVAAIPDALLRSVADRLFALRPTLEQRFQVRLGDLQSGGVLRYRPDDYFTPHRDVALDPEADAMLSRRRVSISLLLNDQSEDPQAGTYCGGSLMMYGLLPDPRAKEFGLPVPGKTGTLVAFPSTVLHEVTPITHGQRYSLVGWFVAATP
jgi:SM-20-related protein